LILPLEPDRFKRNKIVFGIGALKIDRFLIKDPRFTYPYKAMGKANETIIDKKQTQHP